MITSIVDTHVHIWDPLRLTYPWLASVKPLQRAFVPRDFQSAFAAAPIEKIVFVECNVRPEQCEQEVAWIESLVQDDARVQAIVAFADLTVTDERERTPCWNDWWRGRSFAPFATTSRESLRVFVFSRRSLPASTPFTASALISNSV